MTDVTVATLSVPILGDPRHLERALDNAERRLQQFQRQWGRGFALPGPTGAGGGAGGGGPLGRQRDETLALAQAQSRLQAASGDTAGAIDTLNQALQRSNRETIQGLGAQTQLANLQRRQQREAQQTSSAFADLADGVAGLGSAFGALGLSVGIAAVGQFAASAIEQANALERAQAALRAVAGDQQTYNRAVAIATENQRLFGGTLTENIASFQRFLFIANRTGAELEAINRVAQLLQVASPEQGIDGASIALSEFLSGSGAEAARSLVERFELPRSALAELTREGVTAEERLAGLTRVLAEQGVTSVGITAVLDTQAQGYRDLAIEVERLTTAIGGGLAGAFAPAAEGATRLLGLINGNAKALAELRALVGDGVVDQGDIAQAGQDIARGNARRSLGASPFASVGATAGVGLEQAGISPEEAIERTAALMQASDEAAAAIERLNLQLQRGQIDGQAYASALEQIEVRAGLARTQADALREISAATQLLAGDFQVGAADAALLSARMTELAGSSDANRLAVFALAQGYQAGAISGVELEASIRAIEGATLAQADATAVAASMFDFATQATRAQDAALRQAAQAAFEQANAGGTLEQQARAAADALLAAGQAGQAAAAQLAGSSAEVDVLTAAYVRLESARRAASGGGGALGGLGDQVTGAGAASRTDRALLRRFGAGGLAPRPGTRGVRGGGGGRSETERAAEQEARAAEQLAERLQDIAERYQEQTLAAEERFHEQLLAIQEEYSERRRQANEEFADQQFRSRLDFYRSLRQIEDQGIREQASVEFEQFAQQAATIRDEQGADVAARFEGEAARVASERARRAEEIADAEREIAEERDRNRRRQLEGELQYLRDLDRMEREVEQRELDRAARGEDSLAEQERQAVGDAERERQDALASAATAAGEAQAEAQRAALEATQRNNQALADQLALLQQLQRTGALPSVAGATPSPVPGSAPAPVAVPPSPPPPDAATLQATGQAVGQAVGENIGPGLATLADLLRQVAGKLDQVNNNIGRLGQRTPFPRS